MSHNALDHLRRIEVHGISTRLLLTDDPPSLQASAEPPFAQFPSPASGLPIDDIDNIVSNDIAVAPFIYAGKPQR